MATIFSTLKKDAIIFDELSKNPSWWQLFKSDPNLYIEVRKNNQVNVYFEGGSVARIHYCSKHKKLQVFTHHKYLGISDDKPTYIECSDFICKNISSIIERVKSCYSQKKSGTDSLTKEAWTEKYIQGNIIISNKQHYLDSEFAYKDKYLDIRVDMISVINGQVTFVELKRLDDRRMLKESDDTPEVVTQMNLYKQFIKTYEVELLDYYQRLYDIKESLGLPIPNSRPANINTTPELLIFNRWTKTHPSRTAHKDRMEQILKREDIRYSIISEL